MTEEEILEMLDKYPEIPDPSFYPQAFMYYAKMFMYLKERSKENEQNTDAT